MKCAFVALTLLTRAGYSACLSLARRHSNQLAHPVQIPQGTTGKFRSIWKMANEMEKVQYWHNTGAIPLAFSDKR